MIHICKTQTGFEVATLAENGEVLSATEILTSKQNCWKNIYSQCYQWQSDNFYVQDDTGNKSIVYMICCDGSGQMQSKQRTKITPDTKYIPKTVKPKYTPKKK